MPEISLRDLLKDPVRMPPNKLACRAHAPPAPVHVATTAAVCAPPHTRPAAAADCTASAATPKPLRNAGKSQQTCEVDKMIMDFSNKVNSGPWGA